MHKYPPIQYHDYLHLDSLLNAQKPKGEEYGKLAHDETLFIIVHQAYELWFKQILVEIDSVLEIFSQETINEKQVSLAVSRLSRITKIQKVLMEQIDILETMTPLDFLEFRDFLYPASGFQSIQFRQVEVKLGLRKQDRLTYNQSPFEKSLRQDHKAVQANTEKQPSLFDLIEKWLERTPFLRIEGFDFWQSYQQSVEKMLSSEMEFIQSHHELSDEEKKQNLQRILQSQESFSGLFNQDKYLEMKEKSFWRFSQKSLHAALFIQIYRDEPILHQPFRLLQCLLDIDENFTSWRYRHALMALRMLGRKVGTGGSSGHEYLRLSTDKHKIFNDLFHLTTFFIPRSQRPELPQDLKKTLSYHFSIEQN